MTKYERNRQNAIEWVYKGACRGHREDIQGTFKNGDMWCVCDGFRFIRTKNMPEDIPESMGLNLDVVIPDNARWGDEVYLPTADEIKSFIKEHKLTRRTVASTHAPLEALPGWWCNAFYLLDMVHAMPDAVYYRPKTPTTPLYCQSEDGDALLCPVRHIA